MTPNPPNEFEEHPDIRGWIVQHANLGDAELIDVLQRDQLRRWRNGERIPAETYLHLLGSTGAVDSEQALDLVYGEFLIRRELGESPAVEEYRWRFPRYAEELRVLVELERGFQAECQTLTGSIGAGTTEDARKPRARLGAVSRGMPQLDGYDILEELGRGGMGVVYKARHRTLNRLVAIKLIAAVDDAGARARFKIEAEAVAGLQHPNIVQIHEVGETSAEDGSCPYMALEFVEGGTLADRLRAGPLPPREAAELLATLGRAIHFAHQRGIIHRDLKPANILLQVARSEGQGAREGPPASAPCPKVTDFGLAKRLDADASERTQTGAILGTPYYMAPEQAAGRNADIGTPADVYALGAILYECLTGRPPFQGRTALDTIEQVRASEVVSPSRIRSGIPRTLETICLKCLRKEPGARYESAAALADDLARFLAGEPIHARRVGLFGRMTLWCRRNPAIAATITLAVLAVATASTIGAIRVLHERNRFQAERDQARVNLYRALVGEARAQMKARETGWWWLAMDNLREAAQLDVAARNPTELRELAIECMAFSEPCFQLRETWEGHTGAVTALACSPDGRIAASGSRDRTIRLWSIPDGHSLGMLNGHTNTVTCVAFSPNGQHFASCSSDGTVRFWDHAAPEKPPVRIIDLKAGAISQIAFSPDGVWLAAGCGNNTVRLIPTTADRPEKILTGHTAAVMCVGFSDKGDFASAGNDLTTRFWDIERGKQTHSTPLANPPSSLAFNRVSDVDRVAVADEAGAGFQLILARTGAMSMAMGNIHAGGVFQIRHMPRDLWLTASADGTMKVWRPLPNQMKEVAIARAEHGAVRAIATMPNQVLAGYDDGRVCLWRYEEPSQRVWTGSHGHNAVFVENGRYVVDAVYVSDLAATPAPWRQYGPSATRGMVFDAAGKTFAIARDDGTLETWSWAERRQLARWQGHTKTIVSLAAGTNARFASASADGTVKLWQWGSTEQNRTLDPGLGALHAVAWGSDGRYLAASGERGVVLYDFQTNEQPQRLSDRLIPASSVAISTGHIAFSEVDGVIEVRNLKDGKAQQLRGHTAPVVALTFTPDGSRLASGGSDNTIRIWDTGTGNELEKIDTTLFGRSLAFDRTGRYLLCPTRSVGSLHDVQARHGAAALPGVAGTFAAFSPDGDLLLGSAHGAVFTCSMAEVHRLRAAAGNPPSAVRVDMGTAVVHGGHAFGVWGIAVSPDQRWIATAGHDGSVKLWNAADMKLVRTLAGHREIVWSVAFTPDSRFLASGSANDKGGEIRIWEVETGRQARQFTAHERLVAGLAFHPNRPWLASGAYDGSVFMWDYEKGESLGRVHRFPQGVRALAFRPDGKRLVAATGDPRVAVWEVGEKPPIETAPRLLEGHTAGVWSVAFRPNGRTLVSGSDQGVVIFWDGETFDRVVTFRSGQGQIRGLSFTPDGNRLAAAGYAGVPVLVWDIAAVRRTLAEMNLDW